jgi:carbonic anhydrase
VFWNLLWGIAIGFGLAIALLLKRISSIEVVACEKESGELEVWVRGNLSFLSVPSLVARLRELPPKRTVVVHFAIEGLDHAAVEAVRGWRVGYEKSGGKVIKAPLDALWRELVGKPAA